MKKGINILLGACLFLSTAIQAVAEDLVNHQQLKAVFAKLAENEVSIVKDIPYFDNIESVTHDQPGYTMGISVKIRAQMFPDRNANTVEVFGLPAVFYFPDYPDKDPLKIFVNTVEINPHVRDKVLDSAEVGVPLGALSGKKSLWIIYGQTVLKNVTSTLVPNGKNMLLESVVDISDMSVSDAKQYFNSYQGLITSLNQELQKMNNVHSEDWYDEETELAEKNQKRLYKQTFTNITDTDIFTSVVGFMLNSTNEVEEPSSELGHWEYDDPDASEEFNVGVEVINYGTYYEMLYLVAYDEALDEDEASLETMLNSITENLQKYVPEDASSFEVRSTDFYGIAEVVLSYSLEKGRTGKELNKSSERFAKFTKKTYDKADAIAESAAP